MELQIFDYVDYRNFLRDYYRKQKQSRKGFGFASWARKIGLRSPSGLIMIVNGQRHPGPKLLCGLTGSLNLSSSESNYFRNLVALAKSKDNPAESVLLLEKLQELHPKDNFR